MSSRILPSLAILVAVGIFFVYVNRVWSGPIAETKLAIEANNKALLAAKDFKEQENQLEAEKNAIDPANLARLNTLLPGSVDNVHLILDLNALAARSGLTLSNIDVAAPTQPSAQTNASGIAPLPGNESSAIGSVDLTLTAIGAYDKLQAFLQGIELSQRLLDVQEITIDGSDTGVYTYNMRVRIYWLH